MKPTAVRSVAGGVLGTAALATYMYAFTHLMLGKPVDAMVLLTDIIDLPDIIGLVWFASVGVIISPLVYRTLFYSSLFGSNILKGIEWGLILWCIEGLFIISSATGAALYFAHDGVTTAIVSLCGFIGYGAIFGSVAGGGTPLRETGGPSLADGVSVYASTRETRRRGTKGKPTANEIFRLTYLLHPFGRERDMQTWKTVLATLVAAALAAGVFGLLFIFSGIYNVSALKTDSPIKTWVFEITMDRSVSHHSKVAAIPDLTGEDRILRGALQYDRRCVFCHTAPGKPRAAKSPDLNPAPPMLTRSTDFMPNELFWIVRNGIKMTAMPAFMRAFSEDEVWDIASFVQKLPGLSVEDYQRLTVSTAVQK
jgi:mono/diheme cytochrome c family protein